MAYKFDIFPALKAMDQHDLSYMDRLPSEEAKGFVYPVALRFAATVVNASPEVRDWYILSVNERVNNHGDLLWNFPDLQYRLLASCGVGQVQRHEWLAPTKKASPSDTLMAFLSNYWPDAKDDELKFVISQIDEEELLRLTTDAGCTAAESKEILNGYGVYTNKKIGKPKSKRAGS